MKNWLFQFPLHVIRIKIVCVRSRETITLSIHDNDFMLKEIHSFVLRNIYTRYESQAPNITSTDEHCIHNHFMQSHRSEYDSKCRQGSWISKEVEKVAVWTAIWLIKTTNWLIWSWYGMSDVGIFHRLFCLYEWKYFVLIWIIHSINHMKCNAWAQNCMSNFEWKKRCSQNTFCVIRLELNKNFYVLIWAMQSNHKPLMPRIKKSARSKPLILSWFIHIPNIKIHLN